MTKRGLSRYFSIVLVIILLISTTMICYATGYGGGGTMKPEQGESPNPSGGNWSNTEYEYYSITVNTGDSTYARGTDGDDAWLVRGVYTYNFSFDGTVLSFRIGNQSGTIKVSIPEGYKVGSYDVKVTWSDASVNSQSERFDCAICTITINTIIDKGTEEEIPFVPTEPEPTEPEPTEPEPTEPEPTEPEPTEPESTEPEPTEPDNIPRTGDNSNFGLYTVFMALSMVGMITIICYQRKIKVK